MGYSHPSCAPYQAPVSRICIHLAAPVSQICRPHPCMGSFSLPHGSAFLHLRSALISFLRTDSLRLRQNRILNHRFLCAPSPSPLSSRSILRSKVCHLPYRVHRHVRPVQLFVLLLHHSRIRKRWLRRQTSGLRCAVSSYLRQIR